MELYRAQFRRDEDEAGLSIVFRCDREEEALDNARIWAKESGPVELWRRHSLLARFEPDTAVGH